MSCSTVPYQTAESLPSAPRETITIDITGASGYLYLSKINSNFCLIWGLFTLQDDYVAGSVIATLPEGYRPPAGPPNQARIMIATPDLLRITTSPAYMRINGVGGVDLIGIQAPPLGESGSIVFSGTIYATQ